MYRCSTYEEWVVPHEVDTVSLPECSIELDAGAGRDDTLLVWFSLLAVGTLQHGEGAATRLRIHTQKHTWEIQMNFLSDASQDYIWKT